jgi:hypothetical protein
MTSRAQFKAAQKGGDKLSPRPFSCETAPGIWCEFRRKARKSGKGQVSGLFQIVRLRRSAPGRGAEVGYGRRHSAGFLLNFRPVG